MVIEVSEKRNKIVLPQRFAFESLIHLNPTKQKLTIVFSTQNNDKEK